MSVGEDVAGAAQVTERELEEQLLAALAGRQQFGGLLVVGVAGAERLVEDRRVGGQAGPVEVADVARDRAVVDRVAGDVVEPEALPQLVQFRGGHQSASFAFAAIWSGVLSRSSLGTDGLKPFGAMR